MTPRLLLAALPVLAGAAAAAAVAGPVLLAVALALLFAAGVVTLLAHLLRKVRP